MRKMVFLTPIVLAGLASSTWMAGKEGTNPDHVEVSGTTQGNVGCAILEKHMPVKGKLLAIGVIYARTEYRVLDAFNYRMPKTKFTGPGEIRELNRLATEQKIKLVVIPSKYTPEQLDEARRLCGAPADLRHQAATSQTHLN